MRFRAIAFAVALAFSPSAFASNPPENAQENIVAIRLDGKEVIDTTLVKQSTDGDVWLDVEDWKRLEGVAIKLDGKTGLVSAKELGLDVEFLEAEQAINLKVPATLRPVQRLTPKPERVTTTNRQPKGVLVNYDLATRATTAGRYGASLGYEARMGLGQATLTTTGQINRDDQGLTATRGLTTVSYDHLPSGTTIQVGDVFAPRTNLTNGVVLGGIRVASDRALRKDESFAPVPVVGGVVQTDSTAEVFVNGDRRTQSSLKPGPWLADQFPLMPGQNTVRVVVRDDFGREEVIEDGFYLVPSQLPKGQTEWDVSLGLVRHGKEYGTPALSAKARTGIKTGWTVGGAVQATQDAQNVSVSNSVTLGMAGAISADVALSRSPEGTGHAFAVGYDYKAKDWSINGGYTRYSDNYWSLAQATAPLGLSSQRLESSTAVGVSVNPKGAPWCASIGAASLQFQGGTRDTRITGSFNYRRPMSGLSLGVSYAPESKETGVFATYSRSLGRDMSMSASVSKAPEVQASVRLGGNADIAGHRVRWDTGVAQKHDERTAWLQASTTTSKGNLSGSVQTGGGQTTVQGRFQGSVWVGEGGITAQGPTQDAFLVVEAQGLPNVPVSAGGGYVAKTNKRGYAVVPNVQPLAPHLVSINADDVPVDVALETTTQSATARRKAGAKVEFKVLSQDMQEVHLTVDGKPVVSPATATSDTEDVPVGRGGVVVLMQPKAGQELTISSGQSICVAKLPAHLDTKNIIALECKKP